MRKKSIQFHLEISNDHLKSINIEQSKQAKKTIYNLLWQKAIDKKVIKQIVP